MTLASTHPFAKRLQTVEPAVRRGRVRRILSTYIEADGPLAPLGALCEVETRRPSGEVSAPLLATVVGVHPDRIVLAPYSQSALTFAGAEVGLRPDTNLVPVGDAFLGRAVDALGQPIDGGPLITTLQRAGLEPAAISPLERTTPEQPLETGVKAIDGLLTLGQGQRIGVFAAAGVGKTSLMNQLAHQVRADRCVVCLVGERGREVEAFWRRLPKSALERTTLVAATSDQTAQMRVRAGDYALALADHWRREGRSVLLLLDSATRLAMALREIGLAAGEPPTVRAYTPGVFAALPRLVERCGALRDGGSITAVMTILTETDDVDDPIAELMKSLLDGHIVLSRTLAEQGRFPAIDVPRSVSRLAVDLMEGRHRSLAQRAHALLAAYDRSRTMIEAGVYAAGSNPDIDAAIARRPAINGFLAQSAQEHSGFMKTIEDLGRAIGEAA